MEKPFDPSEILQTGEGEDLVEKIKANLDKLVQLGKNNTAMLYSGRQSFGHTEFDPSAVSDKLLGVIGRVWKEPGLNTIGRQYVSRGK